MAKSNTDESTSSSVSMQTNYTTTSALPPLLPSLPPPSTGAFLSLQLADYLDMHQESTATNNSTKQNTTLTTKDTGSDSDPSTLLPRLQIHPHNNDSPSSSPPSSSSLSSLSSSSDDDASAISPLLWVPADRHPEIAPGEFSKWLETNGSNNLARRKSSLRRKSSVLSQTHNASEDEDEDDNPSTPSQSPPPSSMTQSTSLMAIPESNDEPKGNTLDFDRHSPSQDTSRVLAPRANRSLLRRSAFSARGRGRRLTTSTRRHGSDDTSSLNETVPINQHQHHENGGEEENTLAETTEQARESVLLYDRPVSMNEWIDLGCASLPGSPGGDSQQGILSRVHDAESHILSQLSDDTTTTTPPSDTAPMPLDPATDHDDELETTDNGASPTTIPVSPSVDNDSSNLLLSCRTPNQDVLDPLIPASQPDQATPLPKRKDLGGKDAPILSLQSPPTTMPTTPIPTTKSEFVQPPPPPAPTTKLEPSIQRASSERSHTKQERKSKSSWFGGLFGSNGGKEKRRGSLRRVEDERCAQEKQQQRRHDKQDAHPSPPPPTTKEAVATHKKSGLGSLFSRHSKSESKNTNSNKRHHFQKLQQHVMTGVTLAAPLLLSNGPTATHKKALPAATKPDRPTCYQSYRLPIHVERAIYRLSHYKLADPRRPLRHQVAISNLMFWYLSIINTQSDHPTLLSTYAQQQQQQQQRPSNTILVSSTGPAPHSTRHAHFDETANQRIHRPLATADENDDDGDDDLPLSFYKQG